MRNLLSWPGADASMVRATSHSFAALPPPSACSDNATDGDAVHGGQVCPTTIVQSDARAGQGRDEQQVCHVENYMCVVGYSCSNFVAAGDLHLPTNGARKPSSAPRTSTDTVPTRRRWTRTATPRGATPRCASSASRPAPPRRTRAPRTRRRPQGPRARTPARSATTTTTCTATADRRRTSASATPTKRATPACLGLRAQPVPVTALKGRCRSSPQSAISGGCARSRPCSCATGSAKSSRAPASGARRRGRKDDEAGEKERKRISRGERIRMVAQELGPSFVKLGQIASTRTDVIPPDIIAELKKLQDEVPPVPFADIKQQVEESLGAPIADVFARFDEKPLASASIGQVHRAALKQESGEPIEVVVKVQRPGVGAVVARDLELLHMMAAALERAVPETKIYSPVGLVNQFDRSITSELNFLVEADHCERFAQNFEGHPEVRFPKIYRQASSRHVLVHEFFDGKKITETKADGKKIAKASVAVIIKMIFEDGFFHADPHPGNVIILGSDDEPVIGLIDTGMVGRLSPELRERTIDLMIAAARKDTYGVADALYAHRAAHEEGRHARVPRRGRRRSPTSTSVARSGRWTSPG